LWRFAGGNGRRYRRAEILGAFRPIERPRCQPRTFAPRTDDDERIRTALFTISSDGRDVWVAVGQALQAHYGDAGRDLWDEWSATSPKFDPKTQERVWRSFRGSGRSIATLFYHARRRHAV
jgi:hypothetical protein